MKLSDPEFVRFLNDKITAGVEVRIVARAPVKNGNLPVRISPMRLHVRGMVRDGHDIFLGSMSMRRLELGARREVGVIVHDPKSVKRMTEIFEADWAASKPAVPNTLLAAALDAPAKKVAKVLARKIAVKPAMEELLDKMIDPDRELPFEPQEVAQIVRDTFREEIHDAMVVALREVVSGTAESPALLGDTQDDHHHGHKQEKHHHGHHGDHRHRH